MRTHFGPMLGLSVLVIGFFVFMVALLSPATQATTTTTRPAHHRVVQQANAPGSAAGASLGEFLRGLFSGDPTPPPTTTTRRNR
jgi:hypothetical protein